MGGWLSLQADAKWRLSKLLHLASWSGLLHAGHVPELVLITSACPSAAAAGLQHQHPRSRQHSTHCWRLRKRRTLCCSTSAYLFICEAGYEAAHDNACKSSTLTGNRGLQTLSAPHSWMNSQTNPCTDAVWSDARTLTYALVIQVGALEWGISLSTERDASHGGG